MEKLRESFLLDIVKSTDTPYDSQETSSKENFFLKQVKSANDTHELLDIMSMADKRQIEPHHLSKAMRRLLDLQKNGFNTVHPGQLTKHKGFINMCHFLRFKAPQMEVNDLVASLKVLNYFGLSADSLIVQRILHLVKDHINEFTPNSLLFLSFLLTKMKKNSLIEALLIAIPVVFNLNMSAQLDHNNTTELTELLHFVTLTRTKVSEKSMNSIITALTLHGNNLTVQEAKSVLWSLLSIGFDRSYSKLFDNCMKICNENIMDFTFEEVETTLSKIVERMQIGDSCFYNEEFFDKCANFVVEKDVGYMSASYILKKFCKVQFVSYSLLDYIDKEIVNNHSILSTSKAAPLLTLATGLSNASYKSENWEIIKSLLHENPLVYSEKIELPWIKLVNELLSLNFQSNLLIGKVFNSKFLEEFLKRHDNRLDYVQLLILWQSVKLLVPEYDGPWPDQKFIDDAVLMNITRVNEAFQETLAKIFGGREFVQTNVTTSHGHCLDFVVSFDSFENPIAMPCKINKYDELPKSQVKSVAVFFHGRSCYPLNYPQKLRGVFDLRLRTLKAIGVKAVSISTLVWNTLPEFEKLLYLEREIRFALK